MSEEMQVTQTRSAWVVLLLVCIFVLIGILLYFAVVLRFREITPVQSIDTDSENAEGVQIDLKTV